MKMGLVIVIVSTLGFPSFAGILTTDFPECSAQITTLHKSDLGQSSGTHIERFQVGDGSGTPLRPIPHRAAETYGGQTLIFEEDHTTLNLEITRNKGAFGVKGIVKRLKGNIVEILTSAQTDMRISRNNAPYELDLALENPLITSILANDLSLTNPMDSEVFPKDESIFESIIVRCLANSH